MDRLPTAEDGVPIASKSERTLIETSFTNKTRVRDLAVAAEKITSICDKTYRCTEDKKKDYDEVR